MPLTLNNFTGFETEGPEEATSATGSVTFPTTDVRSGLSCLFLDGGGESYAMAWDANGATDDGTDYIIGFGVKFESTTADITSFVSLIDDSSNVIFGVRLASSNKIEIVDTTTFRITATNEVGTTNYHYIEVYFTYTGTDSAELFIDGVSEGTTSVADFFATGTIAPTGTLRFIHDGTNSVRIDDVYILSGASSADDRLGPIEVFGYQAGESATSTGGTPTNGTFTETGDTIGVDEVDGTALEASGASALTLTVDLTDGSNARGLEGGPAAGAADVSGTILAAKYVLNLKRGNGSGTSMRYLYGNSSETETSSADIESNLSSSYVIFEQLSITASVVPTSSDDFSFGISAGTDDTGSREIFCADAWCMLLHCPKVDSVTFANLSDGIMGIQNSFEGPFEI